MIEDSDFGEMPSLQMRLLGDQTGIIGNVYSFLVSKDQLVGDIPTDPSFRLYNDFLLLLGSHSRNRPFFAELSPYFDNDHSDEVSR